NNLRTQGYADAEALRYFPLTSFEWQQIPRLIACDGIHAKTQLPQKKMPVQQFFSDLVWFNGESPKYIAPFLLLSLIAGLVFMQVSSLDIRNEIHCEKNFPLWGLYSDDCSPIERVELMSVLAYVWGCFSGTYLIMHSFALITRFLLTPFSGFR